MKTDPVLAWIHLRDISFSAILGVYPAERVAPRPVVAQVSLLCPIAAAAASDDLAQALNYELVEAAVIGTARDGAFRLLEALASAIADRCLASFPSVRSVRVVVDKPSALPSTRSVAVEIERARP